MVRPRPIWPWCWRGDFYGHRIEKAAELVRAGYVPAALVSGPAGMYGTHESDLAIAYIARKGYPAVWFIPLPNEALSTREEAAAVFLELRRRRRAQHSAGDQRLSHRARPARLFRPAHALPAAPAIRVVAAPDEFFRADSWWRTRQGQKIVFTEWMKTFATALGM